MRIWLRIALIFGAATALLHASGCATPEAAGEPGLSPSVTAPVGEEEPRAEIPVVRLRAPAQTPADAGFSSPSRVAGNLGARLERNWKYIIIHHSGTDSGSESQFDRYHREQKGWRGVGYDFVIGNGNGSPDGLVEVTFRWEKQIDGAHAGHPEYNKHGIGVCLVGNFDRGRPTARQMEALVGLVNYLQERCAIPTDHVYGHRHVRPEATHCPGEMFPWYDLLPRLRH
jgi:hypothetical protein